MNNCDSPRSRTDMASKRGADNIRKFNSERERRNLDALHRELQLSRKHKLQFSKRSSLASYLAERTGIHRTNLERNSKYRSLLAHYLASQPGAAGALGDETDDPNVLRAKLALAQVELGSLRRELRQLSAELARAKQEGRDSVSPRDEARFANVCMLLSQVLTRAETFAIDTSERTLIDLAAMPSDSVVGGPGRAAPYVAWVERNASMPILKGLKRHRAPQSNVDLG